jgi:hypothetical protein
MPQKKSLAFTNEYWEARIGSDINAYSNEQKIHLVFSLLIFLRISLTQFLGWTFSKEAGAISHVATRVGRFMGYNNTAQTEDDRFAPGMIFRRWYDRKRFPSAQGPIQEMIKGCAYDIALQESDNIIREKPLQIKVKDLTLNSIKTLLNPRAIMETYQRLAPFTWAFFHVLAASPNRHRRETAARKRNEVTEESAEDDSDWEDDPNILEREQDMDGDHTFLEKPEGFSRSPILVRYISIVIL